MPYSLNGTTIDVNLPCHMVSSLIQLSREPRYEATRTSSPVLLKGDSTEFAVTVQNTYDTTRTYYVRLYAPPFGNSPLYTLLLVPDDTARFSLGFFIPDTYQMSTISMHVSLGNQAPVFFTSWIVDLVSLQLPPDPLFLKFVWGDTFPFAIVNNTDQILQGTLLGEFIEGDGTVRFFDEMCDTIETFTLSPFGRMECEMEIKPESIVVSSDLVIKVAAFTEHREISITRSVERAILPCSTDLFNDDFDSGSMDPLWNIVSGSWSVVDSAARGIGDPRHFAVVGEDTNWTDYKFQVNTKIEGSTTVDWLKSYIFFRVQNEDINTGSYYRFGIHGSSGGTTIDLYKRLNGYWYFLDNYYFIPQQNTWYNLRVEVEGDSIKGFLNGQDVIAVIDTTFDHGGIGIGVLEDDMTTFYDDVVVQPIPSR